MKMLSVRWSGSCRNRSQMNWIKGTITFLLSIAVTSAKICFWDAYMGLMRRLTLSITWCNLENKVSSRSGSTKTAEMTDHKGLKAQNSLECGCSWWVRGLTIGICSIVRESNKTVGPVLYAMYGWQGIQVTCPIRFYFLVLKI